MLHVSNDGKLEVVEKPRGQKKAMALQLDYMKKAGTRRSVRWSSSVTVTVRRRQSFWKAMVAEFPTAEIYTTPIGPIIGSHTGPGMLALIYWEPIGKRSYERHEW